MREGTTKSRAPGRLQSFKKRSGPLFEADKRDQLLYPTIKNVIKTIAIRLVKNNESPTECLVRKLIFDRVVRLKRPSGVDLMSTGVSIS